MYKETLRQAWVEIDMGAFDHNVKEIKKQLNGVEMIGVIKANGYGHGATECAKVLQFNGCSRFAVATLDEAVALREDGIEGEIVILGLTPIQCMDTIVEYELTPVIMSSEMVKALSEEATKQGEVAKCLFAIDTGMGRIGYRVFTEEEREFSAGRFKIGHGINSGENFVKFYTSQTRTYPLCKIFSSFH